MAGLPHKLDLYRQAVQHPAAEAAFLARVCAHYHRGPGAGAGPDTAATRLREDFAGTAALAGAWVAMDEDHRALAVERHAPTARWAAAHTRAALGPRAVDLHIVRGDVMRVAGPRVDIVAALNFSALIYHDRDSLRAYFRTARRSLRPGGLLVMDLYGGPGAWRTGCQTRRVTPDTGANLPRWFDYVWEQRACDAATGRVDCRIHFRLPDGRQIKSAFRYDWRLWSPPEVREVMAEAGFARVDLWCDRLLPRRGRRPLQSDGVYRPVRHIEAREDWLVYVVGVR